jgi:hypothetical protein
MGCYSIAQLAYPGEDPASWAVGLAALVAVTVTGASAIAFSGQREARREAMRGAAERAVLLARNGLDDAGRQADFRMLCAGLSNNKHVAASDAFRELASLPLERFQRNTDPVEPAASNGAQTNDKVRRALEKVGDQAARYAEIERDPALRLHYGLEPPEPSISKESFFVALLTDLPPRWIEDVSTKRR